MRYIGLWLLVFGIVLILTAPPARSDHQVYLPYVPNTPLMQQVIKAQEYTWCADARSSAYPQFLSQLRDVNEQYAERTGIQSRQVAYTDPGCQVKHAMPDVHGCSGCAAWIYYASWPVLIEYKYQLGYSDWRSTQGHELGHGLLGLHEMYRDSGGTISCTGRTWTVMDCGSGVRYPQEIDVQRGCAIILTAWCGQQPAPPPCGLGEPDVHGNRWDSCVNRWLNAAGWSYEPGSGVWYTPFGVAEWGECNLAHRDCWLIPAQRWVFEGSLLYDPASGLFSRPPLP